jgi:hypothetical protein
VSGWIGVDLDGTLAEYTGWVHEFSIGEPIFAMVERIKRWRADGIEVRIFTARVAADNRGRDVAAIERAIKQWCDKHIGLDLPVTNVKDFGMIELWDDRCVQVIPNTGRRADGKE